MGKLQEKGKKKKTNNVGKRKRPNHAEERGWPSLDRSRVSSFRITRGKTGKMDADRDGWGVQVVEAYGSSLRTTSIFSVRNKKQGLQLRVRKGEVLMV